MTETDKKKKYMALVGKRIRRARLDCNYSQETLGDEIGVSDSHISHIENGRIVMPMFTFLDIVDSLDKPVTYYLQDLPYKNIINSDLSDKYLESIFNVIRIASEDPEFYQLLIKLIEMYFSGKDKENTDNPEEEDL